MIKCYVTNVYKSHGNIGHISIDFENPDWRDIALVAFAGLIEKEYEKHREKKIKQIKNLNEMADPNARLIAAAPELYDWLEYCLGMVEHGFGPPDWDSIRKVLAKARGE